MSAHILVVDDDLDLAEMLTMVLEGSDFAVTHAADGESAISLFQTTKPDLVLLDLMLPGIDGVGVCKRLRTESGVPIIMLTAKSDTTDVVQGLEAGADDYILKPFNPAELVARIRARLREPKQETTESEMLQLGDLKIDLAAHEVVRGRETISLTPLEFELLVIMARNPKQAFNRDTLLERVWGYRHKTDTRLVNVHVQRLRSKIERDPDNPVYILTVRGVGYRAGTPKK